MIANIESVITSTNPHAVKTKMMSTFTELNTLYNKFGYTVQSSLSPAHFPGFNLADIPFTYIYKDGEKMCVGGGISLSEIAFFEALFENYHPANVFIIGNSFGWSTLALGIINPNACTVAIDLCPRPNEEIGLEVTNMMAQSLGLKIRALKGRSPEAVKPTVAAEFDGPMEFVFIDGGHTPEHMNMDFNACREVASEDCIYVFHDVINFQLTDAFIKIAQASPHLISSLLLRTPSGMAICYPPMLEDKIGQVVRAFTETEERSNALHAEGRRRAAEHK